MRKAKSDGLRAEYHRQELGKGVRGKHFVSYRAGNNLVLLRPEVAKAFPTEESVNDALSSLLKLAQKSTVGIRRSVGRVKKARVN